MRSSETFRERCILVASRGKINFPIEIDGLFVAGKVEPVPHTSSFNMGYLVSPYSYANGAAGPIPVSMVSRACLFWRHVM
jgi:hypothetical protein